MSELQGQGDGPDATKVTPRLSLTTTTALAHTALDTNLDKPASPTSPELPTVVATKPPTILGASFEDSFARRDSDESLSSIAESSTEETAVDEDTGADTKTIDNSSSNSGSESDKETFNTPEVKAEVLPSPELASIPLSPADPSAVSRLAEKRISSGITPKPPLDKPEVPATEEPVLHDASSDHPSASAITAAPLDALLSPTEPEGQFSVRDSVATSEATDADDDTRFSTVLLSSARQSLNVPNPKVSVSSAELNTVNEDDAAAGDEDWRTHKKTASNSTILSANNVPYLMSKLGSGGIGQTVVEEGEVGAGTAAAAGSRTRPSSFMGTQQIKEEFYQRQSEAEAVDWDFWGQVINDYQGFAAANPEQLARAIEKGIPKTLRGMIWQLMSASKDPELENTYLRLLKETSPHEKSIARDLGRTFPHHAFFTDGHGIGQENLFNVLKAYSLYDPQVGYCQGLPFIVAILLLNMPDEEAFCLLVRLMHSYDLRGHFLPEMPRLQLRLFQFERLLEEVLPVLHLHFIRQGVKASMYCSQWFLTVFSYRFPMDIVFRIYDNCLASGIEAMFAFSIALLSKNETTLLSMKFDQLLAFLNQRVFDVYQIGPVVEGQAPADVNYRVDEFVQDAISLRITPFMLDNYAHEYEELVRARDAHKIEMENLRNTNQRLMSQVKNLENDMAQLNTEHCQVLNELVMARLRHEELESELVRYKLLYAEAMHQSEDAMSSHRISLVSSKRGSNSSKNG